MRRDVFQAIRRLVGPITEEQLRAVESAVNDTVGVFIPSVGQCGYAITPRHVHPAYSFVLALQAHSPVSPKGLEPACDEYGCTAMSPNVPHEESSETFTRYVAIMMESAWFERTWQQYSHEPCGPFFWAPFVVHQTILTPIKQFLAEFEVNGPGAPEVLRALGTFITHSFIRALLNVQVPAQGISTRLEVQRVIELMHARFGERLPVPSLAREAGLSESQFSRLFKQETGLPPAEYLVRVRVEKARRLLSFTDKTASQIAIECGFASSAHFSATFRKCVGVTPVRYRRSSQ